MKLRRKMWRLKQQKAYEEELEAQKAKEDAARQEEIKRKDIGKITGLIWEVTLMKDFSP